MRGKQHDAKVTKEKNKKTLELQAQRETLDDPDYDIEIEDEIVDRKKKTKNKTTNKQPSTSKAHNKLEDEIEEGPKKKQKTTTNKQASASKEEIRAIAVTFYIPPAELNNHPLKSMNNRMSTIPLTDIHELQQNVLEESEVLVSDF